jgi:triosephosphate isomerase (TIM)
MRTPLIAGNWKMNNTIAESLALVQEISNIVQLSNKTEMLICPPFTALSPLKTALSSTGIKLGSQNIFWEEKGAYTAEISPSMVAELCEYVIIGHSERRAYFNETDNTVNKRVAATLSHNITPIVCVGETLEEKEAGKAAEVVSRQIKQGLGGQSILESKHLVIAYEPVWAIGTGLASSPEDASLIIRNVIRPTLSGMFGNSVAQAVRVLYGGSVKPSNAKEFFSKEEVDGALIGGAALKAQDFVAIYDAA